MGNQGALGQELQDVETLLGELGAREGTVQTRVMNGLV